MIDAFGKIYRSEGVNGLYRGFWVSSVQIVSGVFYIATYESVRHILTQQNASASTKSLIAGGCASTVGQTIIVPFDILSQHLMVLGLAQSKDVKNLVSCYLTFKVISLICCVMFYDKLISKYIHLSL